jgi:hypothetical protein
MMGGVTVADDEQRIAAPKLRIERRAQRPRRKHAAIADAATAVDHGHCKILGERAVLQAVVHDDDAGALCLRQPGAGDAVARDDGRRRACEQQRLVADLVRGVRVRLDSLRPGDAAAITAGEEEYVFAGRGQHLRDGDGGRRLAGAAEGEIADADDRHAGADAPVSHATRCHHSVARGQRRQQGRREPRLAPPEAGLTHVRCPGADLAAVSISTDKARVLASCDRARRRAR